jgi:excisionase family DNA binding protein
MNETVLTQKDAYRLMLKEYPDVVNLEQMCEILGISTKTGYKLLKEKKIDALKVGRAYRIPKLHILSYLNIGSESSKEN